MKTYIDKADIEARIQDVGYMHGPGTITHCYITMCNGFMVIGESACVDAGNFDEAKGRKYAYDDAFEKLWELEGYLLRERLHKVIRGDENHDIGWAVRQMKLGKCVYRTGWNSLKQFVYFVPAASYAAQTDVAKRVFGAEVPYNPYFAIALPNGTVSTWAPSSSDTMAQDWEIAE